MKWYPYKRKYKLQVGATRLGTQPVIRLNFEETSAEETNGRSLVQNNLYEVVVLYHPDLEIDLGKATGKIEKIITDAGGKITKTDNWGKRKLAYKINALEYAIYVFYSVDMPAENVRKVEQIFNITDEIIRFMITKPDLKAIAKAETLKAEKAAKAAANPEVSDEDGEDRRSRPRSRVQEPTPAEAPVQDRLPKAAEKSVQKSPDETDKE